MRGPRVAPRGERRKPDVHQDRSTHQRTLAPYRVYSYASIRGGALAGGGCPWGDGGTAATGAALPTRTRQKGMVLSGLRVYILLMMAL